MQGAYVQGMGYYTCEKIAYDKKTGKMETNRSLKYHVPLALDTPVEYNVKLRYNSKNPKGVLGSKSKFLEKYSLLSTVFNRILFIVGITNKQKENGYGNIWEWTGIDTVEHFILLAMTRSNLRS